MSIKDKIQILVNQFNAKNFDQVVSKSKQLIKEYPNYVVIYNLLGLAYQHNGNYLDSEKILLEGLKLDPDNIPLMNNLAMTYKNFLNYKKAEEIYKKIIKKNDKYINAYVNLGNIKRDLNKFDEAIKLYDKALEIDDKNHVVLYSLALTYQGLGKFKKTIELANLVLEIDPNFTQADHLISQSLKYDIDNEHHQKTLKKINSPNFSNVQKIDLNFTLAKAEEDLGNIESAYKYLKSGNSLKKKTLNYNIAKDVELFSNIKKIFNKFDFQKTDNSKTDNIIFILGMPRSGTSLVEQIISSHSEVFGAGELPILSNIIKKSFIENGSLVIEKINQNFNELSTVESLKIDYLEYIRYFNFTEKYITDKAPLNFRWIGFIKILFPNAKIIHCNRDPKNNCLSMFKNLFEGGLPFTYDEDDVVEYYKLYKDLMKFWESKFEDSILNIKYEDMIEDNEGEIKKIINFCNLDWEENCIKFYKNKTPIKTMSTAQARQPIYKTSVKSFDKYRNFLKVIDKEL